MLLALFLQLMVARACVVFALKPGAALVDEPIKPIQVVAPVQGIPKYGPYIINPNIIQIRDDYNYSSTGIHKIHTRPMVWDEARKACNAEGAHLAIINSKAEAQVLLKMLKDNMPILGTRWNERAWLGLHDFFRDGEWVTIFNDSLESTGYSQWSGVNGGQPNNSSGHDHCMNMLAEDGKLNDNDCAWSLAFFCELPILIAQN